MKYANDFLLIFPYGSGIKINHTEILCLFNYSLWWQIIHLRLRNGRSGGDRPNYFLCCMSSSLKQCNQTFGDINVFRLYIMYGRYGDDEHKT